MYPRPRPEKDGPLGNMDKDFFAGMTAGTIERLTGRFASNEFTWLILCTSARMGLKA
jgi:hypothetical protein